MNADMAADDAFHHPSRLVRIWTWVRERAPAAFVEVVVNFLLPYLTFSTTHRALGDAGGMMVAAIPPIVWSVFEFVRRRRLDALSLLVLAGIVLSLLGFLGGGGVRFLQLREHLVAAVIGLIFLGSAAIGKPLIYQLSLARLKRMASAQLGLMEALRESPLLRRAMMIMTLAWGIGLVAESAISCALIFVMTIQQFLLVSGIIGYGTIGGLTAWTFWYARRRVVAAIAAAGGQAALTGQVSG